jgi:predicted nucleic acid-binding protein
MRLMFLIDTAGHDTPLFLSVITIGELRRGVDLIRHRGDQHQAEASPPLPCCMT